MQIKYKSIKTKTNEWQPQEQVYFSQEDIQTIITEEGLKDNMECTHNVDFDALQQTFNNVLIKCDKYQGEQIFLVNVPNIIPNREWYFCYVTNKQFDKMPYVNLSLTIDAVTSNYDLFYSGKFLGMVYKERANNYQLLVNKFHPDVCSGIPSVKNEIINTSIPLNKNIDIFTTAKMYETQDKKVVADDGSMSYDISYSPSGNIIGKVTDGGGTYNKNVDFWHFRTTNSLVSNIRKSAKFRFTTIQELLRKHSTNGLSHVDDETWHFPNNNSLGLFMAEVDAEEYVDGMMSDIRKITANVEMSSWLSVPKLFDITSTSTISNFELNLNSYLKEIDTKNHLDLHYDYFLVFTNLIKMPIDLLQINSDNKIYGTRIINPNGVIFYFYYNNDRIDYFYSLNFSISNGVLSQDYQNYIRDLDVAYNSGMKGYTGSLPDILSNILSGSLGMVLDKSTGGLGNIFSALGFMNVIKMPFDIWKQQKEEKYQGNLIKNKPKTQENTLLNDALNNIIFSNASEISYSEFIQKFPNGQIGIKHAITGINQIEHNNYDNFIIIKVKPIEEDIKKIKQDQSMYGNIINQTFLDEANPLEWNELTTDHLYFQGKILPNVNPIDSFQLDWLNETLAKGVYIMKRDSSGSKRIIVNKEKVILQEPE